MPTRASFRRRHLAIGRKGAFETELLFAEEYGSEQVSKSHDDNSKMNTTPESPVSIAAALDLPVEVQPLTLPGSWMVVGKGGKPLKNDKMYEEPRVVKKKRKKKRARQAEPDADSEHEPLVLTLEDSAASSKCLAALGRSSTQRDTLMHRAKEAKRWAVYQRAKAMKRSALEELVAALFVAADDDAGGEAASPARAPPSISKPLKDPKANGPKDKARRRARSAADAARCSLWPDTSDR